MLAAAAYLLVAVAFWWNVWTTHPTGTNCGCGDSPLFVWFIEWPAYALAHGLNPFHSTAMNYPSGVNLTFGEIYGLALAPITWVFGPVASVNVLLTLAPAASALAMFALLRRWVTWAPAAFAGGLFYGFSPFVIYNVSVSDGNLALLIVPPIVVGLLDDLLFLNPRRAVRTGLLLGLAMTLQFLLSAEYFVTLVMMGAVAIAVITVYAIVRAPRTFTLRAPQVLIGLATSFMVAAALLVIPVWYGTAGPSHLPKHVWPTDLVAYSGTTLQEFVSAALPGGPFSATFSNIPYAQQVGGYLIPVISDQYFGYGIVFVLLAGLFIWRRDLRLWLFGALGAVSVVLSLGMSKTAPLPWNFIGKLPVFDNAFPKRLVIYTYGAAAIMLALTIGHVYVGINARRTNAVSGGSDAQLADQQQGRIQAQLAKLPPSTGAVVATLVALIALLPIASFVNPTTPMPVRPVVVPTWFRTAGTHLPDHQVLLIFPALWSNKEGSMTWQAVDHMNYSIVGQGGAVGVYTGLPQVDQPGAIVLSLVSYPAFGIPVLEAPQVDAVRALLDHMGVTMVVIPDQTGLAPRDRIYSVTLAASLMTAATGKAPAHEASAWVWSGVQHAPPPVQLASGAITRCNAGLPLQGVVAVRAASQCVLAAREGTSKR